MNSKMESVFSTIFLSTSFMFERLALLMKSSISRILLFRSPLSSMSAQYFCKSVKVKIVVFGKRPNHCEPLTGAVCNIKTSCNANGRITLDTVLDFVKSFFSVDKVEVLLEFAKQLISSLSL